VALLSVGAGRLGPVGLALADLVSDIAAALVCLMNTRGHVRLQISREDLQATLRLGLPAMPDTVFFWTTVAAPFYFLRLGGLAAEAGAFGLAWRLASAVDLVGNSFAVGSTGELLRSGGAASAQRMFRNTMSLVAIASLALGAFAPEVLHWFFPSAMASAVSALPLVCLGSYFLSAYYFEWVGLSGSQRTVGLTVAAAVGTSTAAAAFLFVPVRGAQEAAGLYALSLLSMWLAARWVRTDVKFGKAAVILAGGLASAALGLLLQRLPLSLPGFAIKAVACGAIGLLLLFRAGTPAR